MNAPPVRLAPSAQLRPLRVSVNATAQLAGNLSLAAAQWGFLVALAHLGSPATVGQFALGLAVSGPIMLVASLKLRSVQATDAANRNHFSDYLGLRIVTSIAALIAVIAAATIAGRSWIGFAVIVLVGITKNLEALSEVYRGYMQRSERMDRVAVSMALRAAVALPVFVAALLLGFGLPGALAGVIASDVFVLWSWDVRTARRLSRAFDPAQREHAWLGVAPRFDAGTLLTLARTALPLGLVAMLLSLNTYAPQYAVKQLGDDAALGIFAALLYASMATRVLIGAVGQSASPRLARLYEAGHEKAFVTLHRKLLKVGALVGVLAIVGAALLGHPFLRIAYGTEYASYTRLFVELTIVRAVIHLVSCQEYTVTAARYFRAQLPVSVLAAAATVVSAFLLVPAHGARGAAAAMLAGALVQGLGYSLILRAALMQLRSRAGSAGAVA